MTKQGRQRYVVYFEAGPSCSDELATRQLRGLLKTALRVFGLRCTSVEPTSGPQTTDMALLTAAGDEQ